MSVKVKADISGFLRFSSRLKSVDGLVSRVGIVGDEAFQSVTFDAGTGEAGLSMGALAVVQEFGREGKGGQPNIPARPALHRVAHEKETIASAYVASIGPYLGVSSGRATKVEAAARAVAPAAKKVAAMIEKSYESARSWAKTNAPATVKKKGFNWPLTETGALKRSVSYQVVDRTRSVRAQGKA